MSKKLFKPEQEMQWVNQMMRSNHDWGTYRSYHLFDVKVGTELVIWEWLGGRDIKKINTLNVSHISARDDTCTGDEVLLYLNPLLGVGAKPASAAGVFFWIPASTNLRYLPTDPQNPSGPRELSISLCVKMATNPKKDLRTGVRYVSTRKEYEETWGTQP